MSDEARFRPGRPEDIGPWRAGDEASICRLFCSTFGRDKPVERWRWQFLGQGGEPPVMLARDDGGEVIAHFGGVRRHMLVDGRPHDFVVAVDSMVARARRAGLQRGGLFTAVVDRWVEHFCGPGRVAVGYGLPNHEAARIGRRMLDYTTLGEVAVQALPVEAGAVGAAVPGALAALDVTQAAHPEPDHDELWERCRGRHAVTVVRDRAFLAWRWAACPGGDFTFLAVRRHARLVAMAVHSATYTEPACASLADLIWDGRDSAALGLLVEHACALSRQAGCRYLVALLPEGAPETEALQAQGFRRSLTGHPFVARSFDPSLTLPWLAKRWYFTLADFDLV